LAGLSEPIETKNSGKSLRTEISTAENSPSGKMLMLLDKAIGSVPTMPQHEWHLMTVCSDTAAWHEGCPTFFLQQQRRWLAS